MSEEPLIKLTLKSLADKKLFMAIWNQGIDAHLEAFTRSTFSEENKGPIYGTWWHFAFHPDEIRILVRRLREVEGAQSEQAEAWASDIEEACV